MAISDKTRKILWARSGNLCAFCRRRLVISETTLDSDSVVGDECHIHSATPNGPRHDPALPAETVDALANLILLCRVHHKMVDDQLETYTADLLRSLKANHEKWVEGRLTDVVPETPIRVRRFSDQVPKQLDLILTGRDLLRLLSGCHGSYQDYSADLDSEEAELVGSFLQSAKDWIDLESELEPLERIRAEQSLGEELDMLLHRGFLVFGAKERQQLTGGVGAPTDFWVVHLTIARKDDPEIVSGSTARDA